jgi:hypothetical protein
MDGSGNHAWRLIALIGNLPLAALWLFPLSCPAIRMTCRPPGSHYPILYSWRRGLGTSYASISALDRIGRSQRSNTHIFAQINCWSTHLQRCPVTSALFKRESQRQSGGTLGRGHVWCKVSFEVRNARPGSISSGRMRHLQTTVQATLNASDCRSEHETKRRYE